MSKLPVTILLLIVSIALVALLQVKPTEFERDLRAQHLKAGDFELSYGGKPFKMSSLEGRPFILYFGYTFCPDVCPVGLSKIRDALNSSEALKDVPVLFISLDPERDTAERLKEYTEFFHPGILGLRGTIAQTKAVSSAYGTFFRSGKADTSSSTEYTVDHSAYVYLLDKKGMLMRVLDHDVESAEIAELLHKLL